MALFLVLFSEEVGTGLSSKLSSFEMMEALKAGWYDITKEDSYLRLG